MTPYTILPFLALALTNDGPSNRPSITPLIPTSAPRRSGISQRQIRRNRRRAHAAGHRHAFA